MHREEVRDQRSDVRDQKSDDRRQTTDDGMSVFKIDHPSFRNPQSAIRNSSRGQAVAEYVIIAGLLMASLGILTVFFVTFKEYGGRILALVSSEYP
jgi:hypothetical protein